MMQNPILKQEQIDLFLSPRFLLFSAAICIDVVRICNREQPHNPLKIRLLSSQGGEIPASNGIPLQTEAISNEQAGTVMVLTSYEPEAACTPEVLNWLRQQSLQGARMVCVETGAYVFEQARLLYSSGTKRTKVAAHYEAAPAYRELFGDKISLERLYAQETRIYSSAGAMSTLDLMLNLLEDLRDKALVDRIAYIFNHQRTASNAHKPARIEGALARLDARLGRMVALMQASINRPIPLDSLYQQAGVEASTARRLFKRIMQQSPADYYRRLRLQYGREMLQNSGMSVTQVAGLTGFADSSSFSRAYKGVFGVTPKSKL